jgi:hypothetical protein
MCYGGSISFGELGCLTPYNLKLEGRHCHVPSTLVEGSKRDSSPAGLMRSQSLRTVGAVRFCYALLFCKCPGFNRKLSPSCFMTFVVFLRKFSLGSVNCPKSCGERYIQNMLILRGNKNRAFWANDDLQTERNSGENLLRIVQ